MQKSPTPLRAGPYYVVPVGGLEPPRPKAVDFESTMYTNFITPAKLSNL